MLSPCSIKASIHQIVQKENIAINKTSPSKSLSFNISNCNEANQGLERPAKKYAKQSILPKAEIKTPTHLICSEKNTISEQEADSNYQFQKLFILYSQLKIATA